jgi:quaternary ammonium compound-resistance protein SugE
MAWLILFAAGLFEVGWAVLLKYTEGFTRLWPTVGSWRRWPRAFTSWVSP